MNCSFLPKYLCDSLNRLVASFWWNDCDGGKCVHWYFWDKMCFPKSEGGLVFRNPYAFNLGLLAKQGWRLILDPHSLVAHVFKAKYFPNSNFLNASASSDFSYCWKSLCTARMIIGWGSRWQVGSGESINIWEDIWILFPSIFCIFSLKPTDCLLQNVCQLIFHTVKAWNVELLGSLFFDTEVEAICAIPLSFHRATDHIIWHFKTSGNFSVRSAYHIAREWSNPIKKMRLPPPQP